MIMGGCSGANWILELKGNNTESPIFIFQKVPSGPSLRGALSGGNKEENDVQFEAGMMAELACTTV